MPATLERSAKPDHYSPLPGRKPSGKAAVCQGRERAPAGFKRFRVRADYPHHQPVRYILAATEADARTEYLKAQRLDREHTDGNAHHAAWEKLVKDNPLLPEPKRVLLVVEEMPD